MSRMRARLLTVLRHHRHHFVVLVELHTHIPPPVSTRMCVCVYVCMYVCYVMCPQIRKEVVWSVSQTGGHLGASLGVVELTVALHYVFNTPADKFIFDVGHQAYPHKILTGRRDKMQTIRQTGGLSGFTKMDESEHDAFGAGHSSTSISAGLGMAVARDLQKRDNYVVSVIGDGAITGGMAYEAMNNAGYLDSNMIVVLNDNKQVSLPTQYNGKGQAPVGALSSMFGRLQSNKPLRELREVAKGVTKQMAPSVQELTAKIDEYARGMISGPQSTLFEELGMYYIGPIDGHNLSDIVSILKEIKSTEAIGPVLLHIITEKGRGYLPAVKAEDRYHGVGQFNPTTGEKVKSKPGPPSYTNVFADSLIAEAESDPSIVAIHAAMGGGTGLTRFEKRFPTRCFDVGIAEQHAVTFAAGMATEGIKPFCTIYSTFLQRGYDQVIHDCALQKLPVRLPMDRAGLVGADGPTHCGIFDVAYLACVPNIVVAASSDEAELCHMVATAAAFDEGPFAFRYPRGAGLGIDMAAAGVGDKFKGTPIDIGKGRIMQEGEEVALLGYGTGTNFALQAASLLQEHGFNVTVADGRFCKPLDTELISRLARTHKVLLTVEEGSIGGFASHVMQYLALSGLMDNGLIFRPVTLPDVFIDHGSPADQLKIGKMTGADIANTVLRVAGRKPNSNAAPLLAADSV